MRNFTGRGFSGRPSQETCGTSSRAGSLAIVAELNPHVVHVQLRLAVTSLTVYPLKGALGCNVDHLDLDERGPIDDRRWMLIDDDGTFLSLREVARLCHVTATLTGSGLRISIPGKGSIDVNRPDPGRPIRTTARVWSGPCEVLEAEQSATLWLSECLERSCRLVYQPDLAAGPDAEGYGAFGGAPRRIALTDGAPMLLTSEVSLADLNGRLAAPVPMYRFRPNVVVDGDVPWEEDSWRGFSMGAVGFDAVKPCPRCVATTIDYATATRSPEPLRTLATFRKSGSGVNFGINVAHRHRGVVRVGDAISLD